MDRRIALSCAAALGAVALSRSVVAQSGPVGGRTNVVMTIEAVQMPAWINTPEVRKPIEPGTQVSSAQEIQTAAGAALALRLPEGSVVRLGEATRLAVERMRVDPSTGRTATIGIRVTDFWRTTEEEHDAACLFQGGINLATRDQGELKLDQPTAFWARIFNQAPRSVGVATPQELAKFLASTELQPAKGVQGRVALARKS